MEEKQIVVGQYANEIEAELAKGHLQNSGIASFIFKDDGGGMLPSLQNVEGVQLMVVESESIQAKKILQQQSP